MPITGETAMGPRGAYKSFAGKAKALPAHAEEVQKLQELIKSHGGDLGKAGVDGKYGPDTHAALKELLKTAPDELKDQITKMAPDLKTLDGMKPGTFNNDKFADTFGKMLGGEQKDMATAMTSFEAIAGKIPAAGAKTAAAAPADPGPADPAGGGIAPAAAAAAPRHAASGPAPH